MIRRLTLFACFLTFTSFQVLLGQTFQKSIERPVNIFPRDIFNQPDKGYFITGDFEFGVTSKYFTKLDSNGQCFQSKKFSITNYETISGTTFGDNGNVYFSIAGLSLSGQAGNYLAKINAIGECVWLKSDDNKGGSVSGVVDNSLLFKNGYIYLSSNEESNMQLSKFAEDGTVIWTKYYDIQNYAVSSISSMINLPNGNILLAGNCGSDPDIALFFIEINQDGAIVKSSYYASPDNLQQVILLENEEIIFSTQLQYSYGHLFGYLDQDFNLKWLKEIPFAGFVASRNPRRIANAGNNEFYLSHYTGDFFCRKHHVAKLDNLGNVLWGKVKDELIYCDIGAVRGTPDNGLIFATCVENLIVNISRLDNQGNLPSCEFKNENVAPFKAVNLTTNLLNCTVTNGSNWVNLPVFQTSDLNFVTNDYCRESEVKIDASFSLSSDTICLGDLLNLTRAQDPQVGTSTWYFGENGALGFSTDINPSNVLLNGAGKISITHILTDDECEDKAINYVYVRDLKSNTGMGQVFDLGEDKQICQGDSVLLSPMLPDDFQKMWSNGSREAAIWVKDAAQITLSIVDVNGCQAIDTVNVSYKGCTETKIYLPNVFKPEGNADNAFFNIGTNNAEILSLEIYDRWGDLVLQTNQSPFTWDGKYRDKLAQTGIYAVVVRYKELGMEGVKLKTGDLLLVR
jgi:gliding motility-associated-like protein